MKAMRLRHAMVLVPAMFLAACGGGGGGGSSDSGATGPTGLVITSSNSQAVAAEAVEVSGSYQSASAGSALVTGVQVDGAAGANPVLLARAVRKLTALVPSSPAQATAATTSETVACSGGGSISATATVAGTNGLATGDGFDMTASNCVEGTGSDAVHMNGRITLTVVAGSYDPASTAYPKSVTLRMVTTNFSVVAGADTMVANGDITMRLTEQSATSASVALSSAAASYGIGSHTVTVRNYAVQVDETSAGVTVQVSGTVETNNSRFGTGLVSYQVATPTPVHVDASGAYTAGSVKVSGSGSSLVLSVTGVDTFSLQVDTNGDGAFESTTTVTRSQLHGQI